MLSTMRVMCTGLPSALHRLTMRFCSSAMTCQGMVGWVGRHKGWGGSKQADGSAGLQELARWALGSPLQK